MEQTFTVTAVAVHKKERPFECAQCPKTFSEKSDMNKHVTTVHDGHKPQSKGYDCDFCGKSFSQKIILTRHTRVHEGHKPFKCNLCEKSFSQKIALIRHVSAIHKKERPFECSKCSKTFSQEGNMRTHMATVHKDNKERQRPLECPECLTDYQNNVMKMTIAQEGYKPFECNVCGVKFIQSEKLQRHLDNVHKETEPYACNVCGKTFGHKCRLEKHMSTHHTKEVGSEIEVKKEKIDVHDNLTDDMDTLHEPEIEIKEELKDDHDMDAYQTEIHIKQEVLPEENSPSGENNEDIDNLAEDNDCNDRSKTFRSWACPLCSKTCTQRHKLKLHIAAVHGRKKPFDCDICGKSFGWKSSLNVHVANIHDLHKPFKCDSCGKSFGQKIDLSDHMTGVHQKKRPFQTPECLKIFQDSVMANIHEGHKPCVKCEICGLKFINNGRLKTHINSVHKAKEPYSCNVCGKAFGHKRKLEKHMSTHSNQVGYEIEVKKEKIDDHDNLTDDMGTLNEIQSEIQTSQEPNFSFVDCADDMDSTEQTDIKAEIKQEIDM